MKTPDDYIGKQIKANPDTLPVKVINKDTEKITVYCQRYEPLEMGSEEHGLFFEAGAAAYEIYVICCDNKIDSINHRIEQLQCCHHSNAPNSAPAWIFPEMAMFDIEWKEIITSVRKRMLQLLDSFLCDPDKTKKRSIKRIVKASKK